MKRFETFLSSRGLFTGIMVILVLFISTSYAMAEKTHDQGYLGVSVEKLSTGELKKMSITHGVRVTEVIKGEAADKAGIKDGDVIQYFEKDIIHSPADLVDAVRNTKPDTRVKIKLVRKEKTQWVTVSLGRLKIKSKGFYWPGKKGFSFYFKRGGYLGIHIQKLNNELADYFGVKPDKGVLILTVEEDSPAKKAGLKAGDVIVQMENENISTPEDIHEFLSDYKKGDKIDMSIIRHRKRKTMTVILGKRLGHRKFNILRWKKGDKCVIEIPDIHIPEFQVEIPDSDECKIIIRKNLDKLREKLDRVKEKLHKKLKLIKEYVYI